MFFMRNALERYRAEHGLTYDAMASQAQTPKGSLHQHCQGRRTISAESAVRYHNTLGIPLSELRPDLWRSDDDSSDGSEGEE